MFIVTAKVPKRRYFLLGAIVILAILVAILTLRGGKKEAAESGEPSLQAETNEQRTAYLESLGWDVDAEPIEALRFTLPDELVEPYRSYNEIQLKQGFDLAPYCGETLERYTYCVNNYPDRPKGCQADLYLYDGAIVAGDIVCTGANGFISTLEFPTSD